MTAPALHWYCWLHDSPEECVSGECVFGYWLCPECKSAMESDDDGGEPHSGVWRCPKCESSIVFAPTEK